MFLIVCELVKFGSQEWLVFITNLLCEISLNLFYDMVCKVLENLIFTIMLHVITVNNHFLVTLSSSMF